MAGRPREAVGVPGVARSGDDGQALGAGPCEDLGRDGVLEVAEAGARALVWPTLYEGFGLPPLEAMAKGSPVISSDHPCMREILGSSVYFFDGNDIDSISEAMEKIVSDDDLRRALIRKGYDRVRQYSWKKMAKETLAVYNKL